MHHRIALVILVGKAREIEPAVGSSSGESAWQVTVS